MMWNDFLLMTLLIICVVTDIRERKIYNNVLLPFLLLAMLIHLVTGGLSGLVLSFLGTLAGFSILLIPYFMGGMGAGDVKLLAVIGAMKGTLFVLNAAVYMAIAGAILAIMVIVFRRGAWNRIKQIGLYIGALKDGLKLPLFLEKDALNATYPYGVAIAIGSICAVFFQSSGWLI